MFMLLPSLLGVAAEVSVNSSALLSYLLPEQSFVQVSVHCMCALAVYDSAEFGIVAFFQHFIV